MTDVPDVHTQDAQAAQDVRYVKDQMIEMGIDEMSAHKMLEEYTIDRIKDVLAVAKNRSDLKNPGGWVLKCLEHNWTVKKQHVTKKKIDKAVACQECNDGLVTIIVPKHNIDYEKVVACRCERGRQRGRVRYRGRRMQTIDDIERVPF